MRQQSGGWWFVVLVLCLAHKIALADHMNGTYYGTEEAQGAQLFVSQYGRQINAEIRTVEGISLILEGYSDGGDNAQGTVYSEMIPASGAFGLSWSPRGIALRMTIAADIALSEGQYFFSNRPVAAPPPPPPRPEAPQPEPPPRQPEPDNQPALPEF